MAVQSDTSSISYTGNNSTVTTYAVPFYFLENSHLSAIAKVTATGVESAVTLTNHTGAGDANGGTVRTAVAVPATSTLTIFRTVPATQTTTYQEGGDFPAASHERALDKLTLLAQQNERASDRALKVTEADGARNDMVAVANSLVGLDASKQPKAMTVSEVKTLLAISGTTLDVAAGMKTFADAGERALGVPEFTGQLATQRDTADIYISTGTTAGDWALVEENMDLADFASGFFTADATGRDKFANGFVDAGLIASDAVTTAKILDANVTTAKIADANVTTAKIADANVTTAKIDDGAVTAPKVASGMVVQVVSAEYATYATVTGAIPADDTIPQNTEGTQLLTLSITPSSSASKIVLYGQVYGSTDGNAQATSVALFRNAQTDAIFTANDGVSANTFETLPFVYVDSPSTTSATTYALRFGTPNTFYINGSNSTRRFGGTAKTVMVAMEIK